MREVTILFVDDEPMVLSAIRRSLAREPFEKRFARNAQEALEIMAAEPVAVVVSDVKMPGMDGIELLGQIRKRFPGTVRLVLSAFAEVGRLIPAINTGEIFRYITKPLEPDLFRKTLGDAVETYLLRLDREELVKRLTERNRELESALRETRLAREALDRAGEKARAAEALIGETLLKGELPPRPEGATMAALNLPAEHMGGDFFEVVDTGPGFFDIMIGDVMGKGIEAALIGAGTKQHLLRALAEGRAGGLSSPAELVQAVQDRIAGRLIRLESFVTLAYARIDLAGMLLTHVDCGHLPLLHYRYATGRCRFLKGENTPLGFTESERIGETSVEIAPGDLIILLSDGVTEAASPEGDMFGLERVGDFVELHHLLEPGLLLEKLRQTVQDFSGGAGMTDDFTCMGFLVERGDGVSTGTA